jgi:hypothetical protein
LQTSVVDRLPLRPNVAQNAEVDGKRLPTGAVFMSVLDHLIMIRSEDFGCRVVLDAGCDEV